MDILGVNKMAENIVCRKIGEISKHQDGAIYGDYLFHINLDGKCDVYKLPELEFISYFVLDKVDKIVPHSNAVCFGLKENENDEFPILYANIYNNYSSLDDKLEGTVCAYRIKRNDNSFYSELVQIIRVGFTDNEELWYSIGKIDVRPYGNLVVDTDNNKLYAFVMRDKSQKTRFFGFELPKITDGEYNDYYGVNFVTLSESDIKTQFDTDYMRYLQGATYYNGKIYSVEGILEDCGLPLKFRIIDLKTESEILSKDLSELDLEHEPEFIAIYNGEIMYADAMGNLYKFRLG